jgi:hypothetical protein
VPSAGSPANGRRSRPGVGRCVVLEFFKFRSRTRPKHEAGRIEWKHLFQFIGPAIHSHQRSACQLLRIPTSVQASALDGKAGGFMNLSQEDPAQLRVPVR